MPKRGETVTVKDLISALEFTGDMIGAVRVVLEEVPDMEIPVPPSFWQEIKVPLFRGRLSLWGCMQVGSKKPRSRRDPRRGKGGTRETLGRRG